MMFRSFFISFLWKTKQKQKNISFIYELCVGQELQLEVHHVSFWLVDGFLTKNTNRLIIINKNKFFFLHTRALTYLNARLSRPTFINSIARRSYGIKPTSSRTRSRTNLTRLLFFYRKINKLRKK